MVLGLNFMIWALNAVLKPICTVLYNFGAWLAGVGFSIGSPINISWYPFSNVNLCICGGCPACCNCMIGYVKPVTIECDGTTYAPGYFQSLDKSCTCTCVIDFNQIPTDPNLYKECVQNQLADALNVYKFDFYNDWVNGALYAFLFKLKQKKNGKMKFCAYDCADSFFLGTTWPNPVDANEDGNPDNSCWNTTTFDTCSMGYGNCDDTNSSPCENIIRPAVPHILKEGLIKYQDGNFYYASSNHYGNMKLFATDVTLLGSVNEWNLSGTPVIHHFLPPTTYQLPPISPTTGTFSLTILNQNFAEDGVTCMDPLLFNLNCNGAKLFKRHCKNVRLLCEIGRGLDEDRLSTYDYFAGTQSSRNGTIDDRDIENEYVRQSLRHMNVTGLVPTSPEYNWHNSYRGFANLSFGFGDAEKTYAQGYGGSSHYISQAVGEGLPYNNSYYFYFGLQAGKTSIDKLNNQYFTDCDFPTTNDFIITYVATNVTTFAGIDGSITITVDGGVAPYLATVTGAMTVTGLPSFTNTLTIPNLIAGVYVIKITDDGGRIATVTVLISGPSNISYSVLSINAYTAGQADGEIHVNYVNGGTLPYNVTLVGPLPTTTSHAYEVGGSGVLGYSFLGLIAGDYTLTISDSSLPTTLSATETITVNEPTALSITVINNTSVRCHGESNGSLTFGANGGVAPYTINVTNNTTLVTYNTFNITDLAVGSYTAIITDSHQQTSSITVSVTQPAQLVLTKSSPTHNGYNVSCNGGNDGSITLYAAGGTPPYTYKINGTNQYTGNATSYTKNGLTSGTYQLGLTDVNSCIATPTQITLTQPALFEATSFSNPSSGVVSIYFTGGVGAKSIRLWNTGFGGVYNLTYSSIQTPNSASPAVCILPSWALVGTCYTAEVIDANGCVSNSLSYNNGNSPIG
jgi:hypothetical protein